MGFHVDMATLTEDAETYLKQADKTVEGLETAKRSLNKVMASNALYGSAGEAVSNDINNNLNAILTALKDTYRQTSLGFRQEVKAFKSAVNETSDQAILDQSTLEQITQQLTQMGHEHDELVQNGRKIFSSVNDIVSLTVPHSSFDTGNQETRKFITKIVTDVTAFDHAHGLTDSLGDVLQQTNAKLSQADARVGLNYNDSSFQNYLADAGFATAVAAYDRPIEQGIQAENKAKLAAKRAEHDWETHHPFEKMFRDAEKVVGAWWQDVQRFNAHDSSKSDLEKGLDSFFSGILAGAASLVGATVSMAAWGLDTTMEGNSLLVSTLMGHRDKYAAKDLQKLATAAGNLLAHPVKTGEAAVGMAVSAVGGTIKDFETGNLYNMGEDTANIGSMFVGAGEAKEAINLAQAASKLEVLRTTDEILSQSTASSKLLAKYMRNTDRQAFKVLRTKGEWKWEIQVPKADSVLTWRGKIDWSQVPEDGYVLDASGNPMKEAFYPKVGSIEDRYGSKGGVFTALLKDGKPYGYNNRSLPFVEDPRQYHRYMIKRDFSDLEEAIEHSDPETKDMVNTYLQRKGISPASLKAEKGKIASGFGSEGGGVQVKMPLPIELMEKLGFIQEVK